MSTEKNTSVEVAKKDITTAVLAKIETFKQTGELRLPKDYSPENALKSAYLVLSETKNRGDKPVLETCTKASIAEALLKMVVWGLSPLKKQCYFIPYGDRLECTPDYSGNIMLAKRYAGMKSITPNVVLEGDEFSFEVDTLTGRKKIVKHVQTLASLEKNQVKGAYAVVQLADGTYDTEVMSMSQIKAAWAQGAAKGNSPAHTKFPDQMAKKTVINRACKLLIRASDDAALFINDDTEERPVDVVSEDVKAEIKENANSQVFDFDEAEIYEEKKEKPKSKNQEPVEQPAELFENEQPDF